MKILAFGEILWDIINDKPYLGGAPLNFAVHATQLGQQTAIVSAVGSDKLGDQALSELSKRNVNTRLIQIKTDKPTGTVPVTLVDGQPEYEILRDVAFDFIESNEDLHKQAGSFDALYFGTVIQRSEQNRQVLYKLLDEHNFRHVFCDMNIRKDCYSNETVLSSLSHCTILKLNEEEVGLISQMITGIDLGREELSRKLFENYSKLRVLLVTLGGEGSMVFTRENTFKIPVVPITVVDAIGAGDSFSAAFLSAYLQDGNPEEAAKFASKVGAFVASSSGATPELPPELITKTSS